MSSMLDMRRMSVCPAQPQRGSTIVCPLATFFLYWKTQNVETDFKVDKVSLSVSFKPACLPVLLCNQMFNNTMKNTTVNIYLHRKLELIKLHNSYSVVKSSFQITV